MKSVQENVTNPAAPASPQSATVAVKQEALETAGTQEALETAGTQETSSAIKQEALETAGTQDALETTDTQEALETAGAQEVPGESIAAQTKPMRGLRVSKSTRSGLLLPVGRVRRMLKTSHANGRVTDSAAVYTTAVMEYMTREVFESISDNRQVNGVSTKKRITPRELYLVFRADEDMNRLYKDMGMVFPESGVSGVGPEHKKVKRLSQEPETHTAEGM